MTQQCILSTIIIHMIILLYCIDESSSTNYPRLLLISLDGFRHGYLNTYSLPTLSRIQNEGIKTKHGMQPTFVTITFPNHISIATGMYQEDHGIIHNRFFDQKLQKNITFGTGDEGQWSDPNVEPIWITATKQNKKSAVIYWPAVHNVFHGIRPFKYTPKYNDSVKLRTKIDDAISYFRQESIQLVMLYHSEPDRQGHMYGPDAIETRDTLIRLDGDINYLLTEVEKQLNNDLNIIILSDHGMTNIIRLIQPFFDGFINRTKVEDNILDGPLFSVTPREGQTDEVLNGLRHIPGVTAYRRDEFPEKYHYAKAKDRLGEIIVLPNDEGVLFSQSLTKASAAKGHHGYDNTLPSMQAIFMAIGPDFNQQIEIDSLKNVDVYHIVCKILNITANPFATAGSLDNLARIFGSRNSTISSRNNCSLAFTDTSIVLFVLLSNFFMRICMK